MKLKKFISAMISTNFLLSTLARDVNFHFFSVLDGIHRWNQNRQKVMEINPSRASPLSYDGKLLESVNQSTRNLLCLDMCPGFTLPGKHTGKRIIIPSANCVCGWYFYQISIAYWEFLVFVAFL